MCNKIFFALSLVCVCLRPDLSVLLAGWHLPISCNCSWPPGSLVLLLRPRKAHTQELRKADCRTNEEEYASKQTKRAFLRELCFRNKIAHEPPMPDTQASCDGKNIRKLSMPVRWCYISTGPPPVDRLKSALGLLADILLVVIRILKCRQWPYIVYVALL